MSLPRSARIAVTVRDSWTFRRRINPIWHRTVVYNIQYHRDQKTVFELFRVSTRPVGAECSSIDDELGRSGRARTTFELRCAELCRVTALALHT